MRPLVLLLTVLAGLGLSLGEARAKAQEQIDPPMQLPGRASSTDGRDWLIGVRPGTPVPSGAERLDENTLLVPRERARAIAADLRESGALLFAEPDRLVRRASVADQNPGGWARGAVVPPNVLWPTGAAIAVIDDFVDPNHPDLAANTRYLNATSASVVEGPHGTEVASAAAAVFQGSGVMGVIPGAPIASFGVPTQFGCSDSVEGITAAVRAEIRIINTSYGSPSACYAEYLAVQRAYGVGTLLVASAGNDFEEGNPVLFPAAFPHVMSVAAVDQSLRSASFSSANAAVDISAPGVGVPLAVPPQFDSDGNTDGYTLADGTSFSAPMVAGGASWIRSVRPDLSVGQLADVLRFSAQDLAQPGYDDDTGWGLMSIPAALALPTPAQDPLEPNDGIEFTDGRVFSSPDKVRWTGRGTSSLSASTDQWEDPLDVYRFRLSPRSRARITITSSVGNADLAVYDQVAKSTSKRRGRICVSTRPGASDSCTIVYNGRGNRIGYVAVAAAGSQSLNANYTLRFRRLRG